MLTGYLNPDLSGLVPSLKVYRTNGTPEEVKNAGNTASALAGEEMTVELTP